MILFQLALAFSIPLVMCSKPPICIPEINAACSHETRQLFEYLNKLDRDEYPPLTEEMNNYWRLHQNGMDCAFALDCFKGQPMKEVFESSANSVFVENEYRFDKNCIARVLNGFHTEKYECSKEFDFMTTNASLKREVFTKGKDCFLQNAAEECSEKHFDFLKKNYDELMGIYTSEPIPEKDFCNHPYDKLQKIQCEALNSETWTQFRKLTYFGESNPEFEKVIGTCRRAQKCAEESCLTWKNVKKNIKSNCDSLNIMYLDMKKITEQKPEILKYDCWQKSHFQNFLGLYGKCMTANPMKKDCMLSAVAELCSKDILMASLNDKA